LAGTLTPLVLHLLGRARYRNVEWGAMIFLTGVDSTDERNNRLKQYLLLALRMVTVALLAMALARPVWNEGAAAGLKSRNVVLILDCSASMGTVEAGRSRMEAARDAALHLLAMLESGDRASLLTPGNAQAESSRNFTSDIRMLSARVVAARPGVGRADMAAELDRAADLLTNNGPGRSGRIVIVCDRQAVNWTDATSAFARNWRKRFGDDPPQVVVTPIGTDSVDNVAVESVRIASPPIIRGEQAAVEVKLRSWGHDAHPSVPVTLSADGRVIGHKTVSLGADDTATARFGLVLAGIGSHRLTAAIPALGMENDDSLEAAIEVVQPLKVLIVSGDENDVPGRTSESTFVGIAAAPNTAAAKQGVDPAVVRIVRSEQFDATALEGQQVVILANVGQIDTEEIKAIEQFVYEGGGLLVAPGGLVDADLYNAALYRDGSGILPAKLSPPTSASRSEATTILGLDLSHAVFAFLRGRPDPIPSAVIGRYFPAVPRRPDAAVVATLASGRPWMIEGKWGRGRVVLLTTPLDADWSTLPYSNFYVPFVQSMIRYLAVGPDQGRTLAVGDPIRLRIDEPIRGRPVMLTPSGGPLTPGVKMVGQRTEIRFDETTTPGLYRLRYRSGQDNRIVQFIVQPPLEESNTTPLTSNGWNELAATLGVERIEPSHISARLLGREPRRELWLPLLGLSCAFLLGEVVLARRLSEGKAP
jgi:hypothetical protein